MKASHIVAFVLGALILGLALQNYSAPPATVYLLGWTFDASITGIVFFSMIAGMVVAFAISSWHRRYHRHYADQKRKPAATAPPSAPKPPAPPKPPTAGEGI
jgi:uncharacterized integral membrane protein